MALKRIKELERGTLPFETLVEIKNSEKHLNISAEKRSTSSEHKMSLKNLTTVVV
jgi:hypothetical protein